MLVAAFDEAGAVLSVTVMEEGSPAACDQVNDEVANVAATPGSSAPSSPASVDVDLPAAFAIGEEPKAPASGIKPNRAARRRAKHEGLKAGFLNTKTRSNAERADIAPPAAARQQACKSP